MKAFEPVSPETKEEMAVPVIADVEETELSKFQAQPYC